MQLSYKTRKRLALLILLVALPAYIVAAVTILNLLERPPIAVEFVVYVVLGIIWIVPLKKIFLGVGQPDPNAQEDGAKH
jgi:predicted membrane channel-forming protein YqfA (hemolysin III family)